MNSHICLLRNTKLLDFESKAELIDEINVYVLMRKLIQHQTGLTSRKYSYSEIIILNQENCSCRIDKKNYSL